MICVLPGWFYINRAFLFYPNNGQEARRPFSVFLQNRERSGTMNGHFYAFSEVDTLNDLLTRKHRQRVSTLKKWSAFAVKTRQQFAAVFACREVSRTLIFGSTQTPLQRRKKIFTKTCFTFGKTHPRRRSGGERDKPPFPFTRKGGERSGFTGFSKA